MNGSLLHPGAGGMYVRYESSSGGGGGPSTWEFMDWAKRGDLKEWKSGEEPSYFHVFNVDAKEYEVDVKDLEKKYKSLQKFLHPDKLGVSGGDEQRKLGEKYSALVNEAYTVLRRPLPRARYMLAQRGMSVDEETSMDDLDFLQKVMEIRERLEEDLDEEALKELEEEINREIEKIVSELGRLLNSGSLQDAKELTAKLKYYDNILNEIIRQK